MTLINVNVCGHSERQLFLSKVNSAEIKSGTDKYLVILKLECIQRTEIQRILREKTVDILVDEVRNEQIRQEHLKDIP